MPTVIPTNVPQPSGHATSVAVINVISAIGDAIHEATQTLVMDWAETAGLEEANIFMEDKAKEIIAAHIAGYINKIQPRAHQFTANHATAYFSMSGTSNDRQEMNTI